MSGNWGFRSSGGLRSFIWFKGFRVFLGGDFGGTVGSMGSGRLLWVVPSAFMELLQGSLGFFVCRGG